MEHFLRIDLFKAAKLIDPKEYRYKGPAAHWVHMVHRDNEPEEFEGAPVSRPLTPKVKGQISVSSLSSKVKFPVKHAGRKGYVFHGTPSHHFPFDAHSIRDPRGHRVSQRRKSDVPKKPEPWDEAWLTPTKSKLVGHIYHTKERSLQGFTRDKEGLDFLSKHPEHRAFVRLQHGPIHEVQHNWINHHLSKL